MKRFSIAYLEGEDREPKLERWHTSPMRALEWCRDRKIPVEVVSITEWDSNDEEEILGSINLSAFVDNPYALSIEEVR